MDRNEREHITSNMFHLLQTLVYNQNLVSYLVQEGHISRPDVELMDAKFRNDGNATAISELLRILMTRPRSYQSLVRAARELRQLGAVEILERLDQLNHLSQAPSATIVEAAASSNQTDLGSSQTGINQMTIVTDPELQKALDFIFDEDPLDVVLVRPAPGSLPIDLDNSYELPAGQRGMALILNIVEFDDEVNCERRNGSENDVEYLNELFTKLHYDVYPESKRQREKGKKTAEVTIEPEIKSMLKQFRDRCLDESPSSIIVFIGSHGNHPNQIITSDSVSLDLYQDIVQLFYHRNCPALKGKPKIFLVQACQEFVRNEFDALREPKIEDTLICTAGMPGDAVCRDLFKGSWFVYCFTYMMMKNARDKSFEDILKMVKVMLENIQAQKGIHQVPVITNLKFNRKFYLFN